MTEKSQENQFSSPIVSDTFFGDWRSWVVLYKNSNLSMIEFCSTHKLLYSTFKNWPRRYAKEQQRLSSTFEFAKAIPVVPALKAEESTPNAHFHVVHIENDQAEVASKASASSVPFHSAIMPTFPSAQTTASSSVQAALDARVLPSSASRSTVFDTSALCVEYHNFNVVVNQGFNPDTLFSVLTILKKVVS